MNLTDPVADFLARIRNGIRARQQKVDLQIRRPGVSRLLQFIMIPENMEQPSVDRAFVLPGGIGYVRVASFDEKTITLKGTVTEWVWSNPHCFLKFDVKDQGGTVAHWAVETQAPTTMVQWGWARTSFKAGDEVTVTLQPVKNGSPIGSTRTVTFADGTVLVANGVSPNPPAAK